jgi:hypothetical protein
MTNHLFSHLQDQGYEARDIQDPRGGDWFDLIASGTGAIRVALYAGHRGELHFFDARMAAEWSVTFSPGTPDAVILATLQAAEWALADRRGGPVTPAQAKNA